MLISLCISLFIFRRSTTTPPPPPLSARNFSKMSRSHYCSDNSADSLRRLLLVSPCPSTSHQHLQRTSNRFPPDNRIRMLQPLRWAATPHGSWARNLTLRAINRRVGAEVLRAWSRGGRGRGLHLKFR
jgi:hypothetical protein